MRYRGTDPLVLAIPRGGVPIGRVLADRLDGDLDLVLVRRLGSPFNPAHSIGAVDESGSFALSGSSDLAWMTRERLEREKSVQLASMRAERRRWSLGRPPLSRAGRTVIVVDDALASGATMGAALRLLAGQGARRVICAVPIASRLGMDSVRALADECEALAMLEPFGPIARYYGELPPIEDEELTQLLAA